LEVLINSKSNVEHEIEINVPAEELQPHFDKAYHDEGKKLSMPGFRPGKIPPAIVKKRFGEAIEYQVIEKLADELFKKALEERNIRPIGAPVLDDMDFKRGERLTLRVRYETLPDVVVEGYKGLRLERFSHQVTDEEVDEEILALRKSKRALLPAEKADESGYLVTCDIIILDEQGNPKEGRSFLKQGVDLGAEGLNRDLKAELLNMRAGEEKEVEIAYDGSQGSGTETTRIRVYKIEQIQLPEPDAAFVSEISSGRFSTLDELRADIKAYLQRTWEHRYSNMIRDDAVQQIVRANPVEIPPGIVREIQDNLVEQQRNRYPEKKLPDSFNVEEFRTAHEHEARQIAKWMLLRDAIMEKEKIAVTDAELDEIAARDAERIGLEKDRLLELLRNSPERTSELHSHHDDLVHETDGISGEQPRASDSGVDLENDLESDNDHSTKA